MKEYNLKSNKRIRLWINEDFDLQPEVKKVFTKSIETDFKDKKNINNKNIIVEIFFPRNFSYYGLLGIKYSSSNELSISININDENNLEYQNSLSYSDKNLNIGLSEEYSAVIMDTAILKLNKLQVFTGFFEFNIAISDSIGSSNKVFSIITNILLDLVIGLDSNISEETIEEIIENAQN